MRYAKLMLLSLLFIFHAVSSYAHWDYFIDEDPLTDKISANITVYTKGMDESKPILGFKCWRGKNDIIMIYDTKRKYSKSKNSLIPYPAMLRIDKNSVEVYNMSAFDYGGTLGFKSHPSDNDKTLKFLRDTIKAKNQIVVNVDETTTTFPAKGSTKAIDQFLKTCEIK